MRAIVFQDQTATGKLNAVIVPTRPSGCHCSYMRCCGRSECIVLPYIMRDWPTAKSQMSIISWTSPSPSALILPISIVTRLPSASLWSRSALPIRRTASPRTGAGTLRHASKDSRAALTSRSYSAGVVDRTLAITSPEAGLMDSIRLPVLSSLLSLTEPGARIAGLQAERIENRLHGVVPRRTWECEKEARIVPMSRGSFHTQPLGRQIPYETFEYRNAAWHSPPQIQGAPMTRAPSKSDWHPASWQTLTAAQQPSYPDRAALDRAVADLSRLPPLVTSWEVDAPEG